VDSAKEQKARGKIESLLISQKWQLNKGEEGNKEAGKLATAGAKLSS